MTDFIKKYNDLKSEIYNTLIKKEELSKKDEKVLDTILAFQLTNHRGSNIELAKITGISKSSVQRYLKDQETIEKLVGKQRYLTIQKALKENIEIARIKGGTNSTRNNIAIKGEDGKFIGVKKRIKY